MAVEIEKRPRTKRDRSLEITSIAIGMRDAYYHFPLVVEQKDLGVLACKFALTVFDIFYKNKEQEKQFDLTNIACNYKAGYKLGSQQCSSMDCKEHKRTLANFYKVEAEDGDDGVYRIFGSFKEEVEDLVLVRHIKDIDDFSSKMEKGELTWQSRLRPQA